MSLDRLGIVATSVVILGMANLTGCQSRPTMSDDDKMALWEIAKANQPNPDSNQPGFTGMDWSLGVIQTRGRVTPITSPDGLYIATETGPNLSFNNLMATPNSPLPINNGVQVTRVDGSNSKLTSLYTLEGPLLLGQSADAEGFLVEKPRNNGSQWIGKVDWATGEIDWIVDDNKVNAFGSIGPNGELAWCTREVKEKPYSLAIRFANGEELGIAAKDGQWLMPSWSTRSSRLSVFFLAYDGILSMLSLDCRTPGLLGEEPKRYDLMTGATAQDAFKARQSHPSIQGTPPPPLEEVLFYHPTLDATYLWLPMSSLKTPPIPLAADSLVATKDPGSSGYLVGTRTDLRWQDPNNRKAFVRVRYGPTMPRVTTSKATPFLLFIPGYEGMEVRAMIPEYAVPDSFKENSASSGLGG